MISKELLSEVLGYRVTNTTIDNASGTTYIDVYINDEHFIHDFINIYELAHKCKEMALSKGYHIESVLYDDNQDRKYTSAIARVRYSDYNSNYTEVFACDADIEPEAIFKACEWIMEQTK